MTLRLSPMLEIVIVDADFGIGVVRRRRNENLLPDWWTQFLVGSFDDCNLKPEDDSQTECKPDDSIHPIDRLQYHHLIDDRDTILRLMSIEQMEDWVEAEFLQ